ncbi:MAG: hypothetical protein Q8Q09_03785 [Deltaproteobacteria bacterium]|nr:hypothetical protein [Deltaproteobacteria bacterium]
MINARAATVGWMVGVVVLSMAALAQAQCPTEGLGLLRDVRPIESAETLTLRAQFRIERMGQVTRVSVTQPLRFVGEIAAQGLQFIATRAEIGLGLVHTAIGTEVEVLDPATSPWTARVRGRDGLVVEGVRMPCESLAIGQSPATSQPVAPVLEAPRLDMVDHQVRRCDRRTGLCVESLRRRCQPVGDGSVCGYRVRNGRSVSVFATRSTSSPSVRVTLGEGTVLVDEHQKGDWILVRSVSDGGDGVVVHGWVRARDVRWLQDPLRNQVGLGTMGTVGSAAGVRSGRGQVAAGTSLVDSRGHVWGDHRGEPLYGRCAAASEPAGCAHASGAVGPWESRARERAGSAREVGRCLRMICKFAVIRALCVDV